MMMDTRKEFEALWLKQKGSLPYFDKRANQYEDWAARLAWDFYKAGQKAMQERAAQKCDWATDYISADAIRALPVGE
jgi:hypothetical protein